MSTCSFGVEIHPYYDVPTLMHEITLAEELGYDQVWIGDSQLIWREMYVLLGAAAQATSRDPPRERRHQSHDSGLRGHGERRRDAAGAFRRPSDVGHRQRVHLGQYHGPETRPPSRDWSKPSTRSGRSAGGGRVPLESGDMRLMFAAPDQCPPIAVAASGPKMLRLAGRIADGVILAPGGHGRGHAGPHARVRRRGPAGRRARLRSLSSGSFRCPPAWPRTDPRRWPRYAPTWPAASSNHSGG